MAATCRRGSTGGRGAGSATSTCSGSETTSAVWCVVDVVAVEVRSRLDGGALGDLRLSAIHADGRRRTGSLELVAVEYARKTTKAMPRDLSCPEFEHLRKVFYAENDTKADAFATLRAAREWAMFGPACLVREGEQACRNRPGRRPRTGSLGAGLRLAGHGSVYAVARAYAGRTDAGGDVGA